MQKTYIFVAHSKGVYEGTKYDSITLSDGVRTCKFKNQTGVEEFKGFEPEKTQVTADFNIVFGKNDLPRVTVAKLEKIK